jgi:hypothetical protein
VRQLNPDQSTADAQSGEIRLVAESLGQLDAVGDECLGILRDPLDQLGRIPGKRSWIEIYDGSLLTVRREHIPWGRFCPSLASCKQEPKGPRMSYLNQLIMG